MTIQEAKEWLLSCVVENCSDCDGKHEIGCDKKCESLIAFDVVSEALETIDRLEQTEKKIARRIICDTCSEAKTCGQGELGDWCGEYDVLLKTIKMTLADIRGDNND